MQLVAELADEADSQRQARDAGDGDLLRVEIAERLVGEVGAGERSERLARPRAG